jgi:hypothetical protein
MNLSAYVAQPVVLLCGRGVLAALFVLPVAAVWGFCLMTRTGRPATGADGSRADGANAGAEINPYWRVCLMATAAGALGVVGWVATRVGPDRVIVVAAWLVGGLACLRWLRVESIARGRLARVAIAAGVSGCAVLSLWHGNYNPSWSAKTLFTTTVFVAHRNGVERNLLPVLDDGRNVAVVEGARGTLTVWKHGGRQWQVRENGIPKGMVSADPRVFPQFAPEMLQAAVPLILHQKPQRLMLLGLGSGVSLSTGLSFPIKHVVCVEPDRALHGVVRHIAGGVAGGLLDDDRLTLVEADPLLASARRGETFDVFVSSPDHCSLIRAQGCFTPDFYRRASGLLAADGIFCQRMQFIDLGPEPLRVVTRTLQAAFRDVLAMEVAPGEILFLATNGKQGLVRPELIHRVQAEHVRKLLAQLGLDWSVLLNLAACHQQELVKFAVETGSRPNTASRGLLPFSLPRDVVRWGAKLQEVQKALGPRSGRLVDWMGEEVASSDLVRRLAEVKGQQNLMVKYADQYWAYRASVRDQVTSRPRSEIRQVSHEEPSRSMHPDDRRRVRYFSALGRAVKTRSIEDIRYLAEFESPYDPLLSYFVHQEVAELYARAEPRDYEQELGHRLYSVYYSSPQNQSVRSVIETLRLLREHPETTPDATQRWDDMNALLQVLQMRWDARAGVNPTNPQIVLGEIDASILAIQKTCDTLDTLAAEAGIDAGYWSCRRRAVEKMLVRPLQGYREQILPHHHRAKLRQHQKKEEAGSA